jgi:hypothetical protein
LNHPALYARPAHPPGGCYMTDAGKPIAAAIDGQDAASWRLPLAPLGPASLPEPYSPGENPALDRLEAAARMVGAGQGREARAPLCSPAALLLRLGSPGAAGQRRPRRRWCALRWALPQFCTCQPLSGCPRLDVKPPHTHA